MQRQLRPWIGVMLALIVVAAGCGRTPGADDAGHGSGGAITPTPPAEIAGQAGLPDRTGSADQMVALQAGPTATPTPASPLEIRVWWPDELYPAEETVAHDVLINQFESFRLTYSTYALDVRRKRSTGLGGILSTLRAAEPVAPGALPDLTLMRRSDMLTAATEGLIMPLDGWAPGDLIGTNLFPGVLALGEIDGELFGLPYALNIHHAIYRAAMLDTPLYTFSDVLAANPTLVFPVNHASSSAVNLTVLLQYVAAGGRLIDTDGAAILDHDPLQAVLDYYEQAVGLGIVDSSLEQYTEAEDYWALFANAQATLIGIDAWTYLRHKEAIPNIGLAPIPTLEGTPITALEGWMWVLTTTDPDRQQQARAFLSWMMRISQQSLFTEAMGVLPSQERALRLWDDATYASFASTLILSAEVIPLAQRTGSAAIALQDALEAVLEGARAEDATEIALATLGVSGE